MARFFTSDQHLFDSRIDLLMRPFKKVSEMNDYIINAWNSVVGKKDEVWTLGDFSTTKEGFDLVKELNGRINLIIGNYDVDNLIDPSIFLSVQPNKVLKINGIDMFLTHKPEDANPNMFNLVGHIHDKWKVQRNMINVGVDAWHFLPVSEQQIELAYNGIKKHYDKNVFIGEYYNNPATKIGKAFIDFARKKR